MASLHHQPYHHSTTLRRHRRHSLDSSTTATTLSLPSTTTTPFNKNTLSTTTSTTTFSLSATTTTTTTTTPTTTTSPSSTTLSTLEVHLAAGNFRLADDETRRLLIALAGDAAIKRGYVFFSEVQFIPSQDLQAIDQLWTRFSNNRFGYSVQKKIWVKCNKDFTRFFMQVGWMKRLDTEIEQYNYRSFPNEFLWELNTKNDNDSDSDTSNSSSNSNSNSNGEVAVDVPPLGHLPLTNALRGTQLLTCIFNHPAFAEEGDEGSDGEKREKGDGDVVEERESKKKTGFASLRDRLFKPNYSF